MEGLKELFQERFNSNYKAKRLLAVQLNGFSHRVIYDSGSSHSQVVSEEFSGYAPEQPSTFGSSAMFKDIPHYTYQGRPKEIIYILPDER